MFSIIINFEIIVFMNYECNLYYWISFCFIEKLVRNIMFKILIWDVDVYLNENWIINNDKEILM